MTAAGAIGTSRPADEPAAGAYHARDDRDARARRPDATGVAERDGGRIAWEASGSGEPPIVFVPPWQIVHSRVWKAQLPDFARRHRVVAFDARGNGRSDRPTDPAAHTTLGRAADVERVMDATKVGAAVLVGLSSASGPMLAFTADHPERVLGLVFVCPSWPLGEMDPARDIDFEADLENDVGWQRETIHAWRRDFRGYLEWFFSQAFPEPHSTKQREDAVGYGLATDPESLAATMRAPRSISLERIARIAAGIRCPTLVIQGTDERISHLTQGTRLAEAIPGARLELIAGGGHIPNARDPVRVNLLIRDFLAALGQVRR